MLLPCLNIAANRSEVEAEYQLVVQEDEEIRRYWEDSSDLMVWRFAQDNEMMLLTANRKMRGKYSLEETIRTENRVSSLPVITIGNVDK